MTRTLRLLAACVLIGAAIAVLWLAALRHGAFEPLNSTWIEINGRPWSVASLSSELGVWGSLALVLALVFALVLAAIVLPLALLAPLLLAALLVAGTLLLAVGIVVGLTALLVAPLLVVGALLWLLWRGWHRTPRPAAQGARAESRP